jgi:Na+/proline symporter
MQYLSAADYIIFLLYFITVAVYGLWIYHRKKKAHTDTNDYFLAEGSLTWWAIGASLIASNISAEQFIGMSGSGFLSPGIFAMFLLGLFWNRTNSSAALFSTVGCFIASIVLKFLPVFADLQFLAPLEWSAPNAVGIYEIPFLDRMMIVFVFCVAGMVLISLSGSNEQTSAENEIVRANPELYRVHPAFKIGSILVLAILVFLYIWFW